MTEIQSEICPHWVSDDRSCRLSPIGLYLPVQEHIESYCEGGNFYSCTQFETYANKGDATYPADSPDKRRHPRIPARFSFRLAERSEDSLNVIIDDAAITVDLSRGGIRFESYRSLQQGSEVIFSLNGDFSDTPLQGTGQVKWCRSMENAPLYHAGIAFSNPEIGRAVGKRFGLAVN